MIQLKSSADVGNNGIKTLLYGRSGSGKTPTAATAPNVVMISAESGLLSIKRNNPPIPYIEIRNMTDLIEAYNWSKGSQEAQQFQTVALDSISEIMEVLLTHEKGQNKDPRKAYGELADKGIGIIRAFRDLPGKHTVIVCKEEYVKDEGNGMMIYQPMLPGKQLGQQIPYFFDETFRMVVGNDPVSKQEWRALRTRLSFSEVARDRSGLLNEFEPPNLTAVFNKILGR